MPSKFNQILIYSYLFCAFLLVSSLTMAQQQVGTIKKAAVQVIGLENLQQDKTDLKASHLDELEFKPMSEFQQQVQARVNEVKAQGYGRALLLQPFKQSYRVYKFRVVDNQAVQGDIILGGLREVVRQSLSNRDAGFKDGDPATAIPKGSTSPPPLIADATFRWPDNKVPYEIKRDDFTSGHVTTINKGIEALNNNTNLTLVARRDSDKDYVLIIGDKDMQGSGLSKVGRIGGKQKLTLNTSYENKFDEGTVVHEFMHAVGFHHEQTRSDRDKYISVLRNNIIDGMEHNFDKDDVRVFGDYNYQSIMHYSKTSFGRACTLSDYAKNRRCNDCSIKTEQDFLAAQSSNTECKKITMKSKTATDIRPSNSLTTDDIAAINAAYPAGTTKGKGNSLPPLTSYRTFSLTLEQIKRVAGSKGESGATCGKYPDFIGELVAGDVLEVNTGQDQDGILIVNDTTLSKTKRQDKKVGDTVNPNWTLDVPVGPNQLELYLIIKVWEFDDTLCGGKNDLVDVSPQKDQAYLRLIVNLDTGELQYLRPQSATPLGGVVYYERAKYSGKNIFDFNSGKFISNTFSGLDDKDATSYQMEASVTIKGTVE